MMIDYLAAIAEVTIDDKRFDGLRDVHHRGHANYDGEVYAGQNQCSAIECPGYTINSDLAKLLACIEISGALVTFTLWKGKNDWVCAILIDGDEVDLTRIERSSPTPLEAASKAVYGWLLPNEG